MKKITINKTNGVRKDITGYQGDLKISQDTLFEKESCITFREFFIPVKKPNWNLDSELKVIARNRVDYSVRVPLDEGTPLCRGSTETAFRNARAVALNNPSAM